MFKSSNEAFDWMVSFTNLEKKPDLTKRGYRLDKMYKLLSLFNNPHMNYKVIHVAGSKGKGSTCAFLSSILTAAGFKTGVYSSPHLLDYRERITNNHSFFNESVYIEAVTDIYKILENIDFDTLPGGEPTTFELMTLAAFIIFSKEQCQWVVLETGLGGRLDATTTCNPEASVITQLELEHTDLLGNTIAEIAFEKGGIIKEGKPLFTSNRTPEAVNKLKEICIDRNSEFHMLQNDFTFNITKDGTFVDFRNSNYKLGLFGEVQVDNAVLAISTINFLLPDLNADLIVKGIRDTSIPGRFQIVERGNKRVILDGAHTKNSIKNSINNYKICYNNSNTIIFGAIKGKDIASMVKLVADNFNNIIISKPGTFKESNLNEIEDLFTNFGKKVSRIESGKEALDHALNLDENILVTGSFYMAGEIAKVL